MDHWKVVPDLICMAKGLTSSYIALGAVGMRHKIAQHFQDKVFYGGLTYNSHPISLAAGRAVLKVLREKELVRAADSERQDSTAATLRLALEGLRDADSVGDVRGIGLLWGVEFVADKATKQPFSSDLNFAGRVEFTL